MERKKEYIGLLDSGVGGLSVLRRLVDIMPDRNYIFFGDTKNVPYGTKTPQEIFSYTKEILEFFIKQNVKNVVFACNTTSAVAYDKLKENFSSKLNIFPLIQTVAKSAILNLKDNDTIAICATKATINSHKYREEIQKINPKINVLELDCTGFVEIVENRLYNDVSSINLIKEKLEIVRKANSKRVVLGCTHYPYLEPIFKKILDVEYFDPAISLAKAVKANIGNSAIGSERRFFVSKNPENFIKSAKMFYEVESAELVNL